jgi:folylpolyglutamate synthase
VSWSWSNFCRWDCISIDNKPVDEALFRKIEKHYIDLSVREGISASTFEILTATAFHIFNEAKVKIGVVEVGMGGKLDATNILNNQAVSVISKIARDHENFLGDTLEEITLHKAGILRPHVPYLVNPHNERNVRNVIDEYARDIEAGPRLENDPPGFSKMLFANEDRPPAQLVQRQNIVLAARAAQAAIESVDRAEFTPFVMSHILHGARFVPNPGRLQPVRVPPIFGEPNMGPSKARGEHILVDGAHNPDAARLLSDHVRMNERRRKISGNIKVPRWGWPVTWVLAMTDGKDAHKYLSNLLKPGDSVITTTFGPVDGMPWVKPMNPQHLLNLAKAAEPSITGLVMSEEGPLRALCTAKFLREPERPIVLTGSLYLVGDLYRELRANWGKGYWEDPEFENDRKRFAAMLEEEKYRVNRFLSANNSGPSDQTLEFDGRRSEKDNEWKRQQADREKRRAMQEEIEALDREMELLTAEEQRLAQGQRPATPGITESSPLDEKPKMSSSRKLAISSEKDDRLPSKHRYTTSESGVRLRYHEVE